MTKSLVGCVLAFAVVCSAGPITYTVSQTVGLGGVTGTITTDGNLGTLTSGDISAFDLTISDGSGTVELVNPQDTERVLGTTSGLSATLTGLFFNYSVASGFVFEGTDTPTLGNNSFVCWEGGSFNCTGGPNGIDICRNCANGTNVGAVTLVQSGTQQIASSSSTATVTPEPSSLLLVGLGAGVLGYSRRKLILQR